jgi:hypothetical protein
MREPVALTIFLQVHNGQDDLASTLEDRLRTAEASPYAASALPSTGPEYRSQAEPDRLLSCFGFEKVKRLPLQDTGLSLF